MSKSVQIDMDLFFDLYDLTMEQGDNNLQNKMKDKMDRLLDHAYFSMYKRSPVGSQERENFRKKYLDHRGVLPSFRSETEIIEDPSDDDNDSPDF